MPKIEEAIYAEAKRQHQYKFGKYKNKRTDTWNVVKDKEPMQLLQEYKEVLDQIKSLNRRRKHLKEKIDKFGGTKIVRSGYQDKPIQLYVLKLEHDCWYVGMSRNVDKRFKTHKKGKGALWTKAHQPLLIHEVRQTGLTSDSDASILEDELTLEYALTYGHENVRGGGYCQTKPRWPAKVIMPGIL